MSSRSTTPTPRVWKRERLREAGIEPAPGGVGYVGVDFERDDLLTRLVEGGFQADRPATFLWLGVVPYLSPDAVAATLRHLGALPGAEVVLDYPAPTDDPSVQALREDLARRTAAAGEPMRASFEPAAMDRLLRRGRVHRGRGPRPGARSCRGSSACRLRSTPGAAPTWSERVD